MDALALLSDEDDDDVEDEEDNVFTETERFSPSLI